MRFCALVFVIVVVMAPPLDVRGGEAFPGEQSEWRGFKMYDHQHMKVVVPNRAAEGRPWVWRARFFDLKPKFDVAMLNQGYHVVYCDVTDLFGSPKAVKRWDDCYEFFRSRLDLAEKVVLEGMSRGGLIIYNWAIANPDKVAVIYGDAPVMDFKSWPGHRDKRVLKAYGFKNKEEAYVYEGNPIDNLAPLARAGVPIIHVVGDIDPIVPVSENTEPAAERYRALGGTFEVIHKPNAKHDHGLEDPTPLVEFVMKHTRQDMH